MPNGYPENKKADFKEMGLSLKSLPFYRAHLMAKSEAEVVYLTEGEKDCDALVKAGLEAVATVGGANTTVDNNVFTPLCGKLARAWGDNDDAGRNHMQRNSESLRRLGIKYQIVEWTGAPIKGGAHDFFASGGTVEELQSFPVVELEKYVPKPKPHDRKIAPPPKARAAATGFELTDLGNAERLVEQHGKDLKYVSQLGWLAWDGKRWARDEGSPRARELAAGVGVAFGTRRRGSATLRPSRGLRRMRRDLNRRAKLRRC